jgi:acyl dehydratase
LAAFNSGPGGLGVLTLGVAEHQRLHGRASHGGLTSWEAMRVADRGAKYEIGNICVLSLGECGLRFLKVRFSKLDGA